MGVSDWVAMGGWVLAGGEREGGGAEPEEERHLSGMSA